MSRLLPSFLSKTTKENEAPYGALLAGSALSYTLCIISYFVPAVEKNLFRISIVAVVAFQDNDEIEIIAFSVIIVLLTLFYFGYSRKRQIFSAAENRVMLVAHVTKFNIKKVAAGRRTKLHKASGISKRTGGGGTEASQTEKGGLTLKSAKSATSVAQ
ncbi:hypothetical protein JG687_00005828 [Phytophthora cactorum]|uniref:Uncharacterized protein n=1 Tax=Phytophthora cactorum TaxID=29920 RepID=A0A8T1UJT6_9STRA|nr:hypothetical protein JG687_00005828 [Phytophthora cactorum]